MLVSAPRTLPLVPRGPNSPTISPLTQILSSQDCSHGSLKKPCLSEVGNEGCWDVGAIWSGALSCLPRNWDPAQPDNWRGHELGASEDCAEIRRDGLWNDDFCQQVKRWVCEMKRNITI